ncbi:MAG TPA: alpha/beta fold hydrolase [Angustibacter sp.]|nr:alpha/beta fold hydrolase [Angustibacter sp.]
MIPVDPRGARTFQSLIGAAADSALESVRARSPQMFHWLLDGAFSQPLADPRLSWRDREVATVAVLAALGGAEPQLRVHLKAALQHDVTADELRALAEHTSVYAGFPRALNALDVVHDVLAEHADPQDCAVVPVRQLALADHTTQLAAYGDSGPTVVLLHALGLTWQMWEPVIRRLAVGRRVLAYDLRGHGAAVDAPAPTDVAQLADDLLEVLHAVEVERAHVVGLSYGGGVAQTFAVRHPDRAQSLTLAATTDRPFDSFVERAAAVERDGVAAQVVPSLTRWFTPQALAENGWGVRYARECVLRGDPRQVAAAWRSFARLDVAGRLRGWQQPTLVLCGERDASTGPAVMTRLAQNVSGATYVELPGAPHMPTLETPGLVVDALDAFLPSGAVTSTHDRRRTRAAS